MPATFATIEDAERYFRTVLALYGELIDEHWRHLTTHSVRWEDTRQTYAVLCDPKIARGFRQPWFQPLNLWAYWKAISGPILVLRGARSDLLSPNLAAEMRKRNRAASIFQFDNRGHVPPPMAREQINIVIHFLRA